MKPDTCSDKCEAFHCRRLHALTNPITQVKNKLYFLQQKQRTGTKYSGAKVRDQGTAWKVSEGGSWTWGAGEPISTQLTIKFEKRKIQRQFKKQNLCHEEGNRGKLAAPLKHPLEGH